MIRRAGLALALILLPAPTLSGADSFDPVRLAVSLPPTARLDRGLPLRVQVSADPGALDVREGPVRLQVKLTSGECGGVYAYSPGSVIMDVVLSPQPSPGRGYLVTRVGGRRPVRYGVQAVCAYLDDDVQQLASDTTGTQVNVSRACTSAADRYDDAVRRRGRRSALARTRLRQARRACGRGVVL